MIARPKISRNERKTTEIGAFEVGNFAPFSCPGPHGDECRFAHPADRGGPRPAGGEALAKKCLEFKKKGRCSRGDACPFRHVARAASGENRPPPEGPKPCFTFAKKGKCRKGAACKFAHV